MVRKQTVTRHRGSWFRHWEEPIDDLRLGVARLALGDAIDFATLLHAGGFSLADAPAMRPIFVLKVDALSVHRTSPLPRCGKKSSVESG